MKRIFYFILNDGEYIEEKDYIKHNIKLEIEYELNILEKNDRMHYGKKVKWT